MNINRIYYPYNPPYKTEKVMKSNNGLSKDRKDNPMKRDNSDKEGKSFQHLLDEELGLSEYE